MILELEEQKKEINAMHERNTERKKRKNRKWEQQKKDQKGHVEQGIIVYSLQVYITGRFLLECEGKYFKEYRKIV